MLLPIIMLYVDMLLWRSGDFVYVEHTETKEHMATQANPTMFDPFPTPCNGLDVSLWGGQESPVFEPPPFQTFLNDIRCAGAEDYEECLENPFSGGQFYQMDLQGSWLSRIAEVLQADPAYVWPQATLALTGAADFEALDEVKDKFDKAADDATKPMEDGYAILNKCDPGSAACRRAWIRLNTYLQTASFGWEPRYSGDDQCAPLEDLAKLIEGNQTSKYQEWEADMDITDMAENQDAVRRVVEAGRDHIFKSSVPMLHALMPMFRQLASLQAMMIRMAAMQAAAAAAGGGGGMGGGDF
jgi:hypothetical protein